MNRFFFDTDSDGHWYVVSAAYREQWGEWQALDGDDEAAWSVPDFAIRLEYHPSLYSFEMMALEMMLPTGLGAPMVAVGPVVKKNGGVERAELQKGRG